MRTWYLLAGLAALGSAALVGWVTLGSAQPATAPTDKPKSIIERVPVDPPDDDPRPGKGPIEVAPIPIIPPPDITAPGKLPTKKRPIPATEPRKSPIIIDPVDIPREPSKIAPPADPLIILEPIDKPAPIKVPDGGTTKYGPAGPIDAPAVATQPTVSLEWSGPATIKVGTPADYTLAVNNTGLIPVQRVAVQVRLPAGVTLVAAEPKTETADGVLVWELGSLAVRQETLLKLKVTSPQRGDVACQAWVTFTGSAVMKMKVRDPKLVVKVALPEKTMVGEPANVVLTVSNPGDHPAEHVRVSASLPEGLECTRGNRLQFDLGALNAGDTRTLTVPCLARSTGRQQCDVSAEADGGLKSSDAATVQVVQPRLDLTVTGPKLRYLDRKGIYTMKVTNPGEAPATNVFVTEVIPTGFKFVAADAGGQHDNSTGSVKWFVGELAAGESKEVKVELMAVAQGEFTHRVMANASRGMKAEQELKTAVEGLSAILMELVDVEDPVETGADTAYEIKVTNTGSKAETDVKLTCTLPPQLKLKNVQGPVKYEVVGNDVVFQPMPKLAPRADVVYKVTVTAVQKGDARFKASLTTASLVEPVVKVEPTKVYAD